MTGSFRTSDSSHHEGHEEHEGKKEEIYYSLSELRVLRVLRGENCLPVFGEQYY